MSWGPGDEPKVGATPIDEPWRLSHMLGLVFGAALFFWAYARIGAWAVVLLVVFTIVMIGGAIFMRLRSRDAQRYALLWMLAIASDHRMPLGTSVEAFAGQYRGAFRRRMIRLAALLDQGAGVSYALRAVPGLTSAEAAMMVEVGEENGRLGEALRRAAAQQSERAASGQELASQASYLGIVLLIGQGIVFFVLYYILPKFEAIFRDFGVPLPSVTVHVIRTAHFLAEYFFLVVLLPVLTALVFLVLPRITTGGATAWLPMGLGRRRHAGAILRALAMTAEANRPMEAGMHTLAVRYPSERIRRRIAAAEEDVKRGADWREALYRRGLIRPVEFEVLATAQAVGNLPWAMNDLADSAERRANLQRALIAQALWPLMVGSIGMVVLILAVAFFLPLIDLIGRLSG